MRTQAEAALVLVHIVVNASEPVNDVNGVVRGLLDVCQSEHPTVRNRAVHVLGVLKVYYLLKRTGKNEKIEKEENER